MELKFATNQVNTYKIHTPVYQGPLDLLLNLIENAELDITELALAQVTDQYLQHLNQLDNSPPDEISAFLVIAAKLILIKSKALLPNASVRDDEDEDLGDDLARQLIAYKRYKEIAEILAGRKDSGFQSYIRVSPAVEINEKVDLGEFDIEALYNLARKVFQVNINRQSIDTVVERPKITIRDKVSLIVNKFQKEPVFSFDSVLGDEPSKLDIVISFLAVLELIKGKYIRVRQNGLFDQINLERTNKELDFDIRLFRELEL